MSVSTRGQSVTGWQYSTLLTMPFGKYSIALTLRHTPPRWINPQWRQGCVQPTIIDPILISCPETPCPSTPAMHAAANCRCTARTAHHPCPAVPSVSAARSEAPHLHPTATSTQPDLPAPH